MNRKFRIVFMGTPGFAVPSLESLHHSEHRIIQVVTRPDRPKGRGRKLHPPPIKSVAVALGCDVVQPASINQAEFVDQLAALQPDVFVVVAFGQLLSPRVLDIPAVGTVNVHASLLPKYRGPAPIQWAIINGEKTTGITTMMMDEGLDSGDILMQVQESIRPDDSAAELHDRLAHIGGDLLVETLNGIANHTLHPVKQDHAQATHAPLLKKSDGRIQWDKPAPQIADFIRGMSPWPGAFTALDEKRLKIFRARPIPGETDADPGTVLVGFPDELIVATGKGRISILEIQSESGKRLKIKDFLRGKPIPAGTVLN